MNDLIENTVIYCDVEPIKEKKDEEKDPPPGNIQILNLAYMITKRVLYQWATIPVMKFRSVDQNNFFTLPWRGSSVGSSVAIQRPQSGATLLTV